MAKFKIYLDSSNKACKPNTITLSKVYSYLKRNGHTFVSNFSHADYVIVNTCGFMKEFEMATVNLFQFYSRNKSKVISIGCLNKINGQAITSIPGNILLINELKELDPIFFNQVRFDDVTEYCMHDEFQDYYKIQDSGFSKFYNFIVCKIFLRVFGKKSYFRKLFDQVYFKNKFDIQINTGCASNCNFCVIKKAIGKVKSRNPEHIIQDIENNSDFAKTIHLVSDDCGPYGLDIGLNLPRLLKTISNRFGNRKIDLGETNPFWILRYRDELLDAFRNIDLNSVYIPIQSGSNRVLSEMNRNYDIREVMNVIKHIKKISPKTFISTHAMVGFPGEGWRDFFKTLAVLRHFDYFVGFAYSDRGGARSCKYTNKNPDLVIRIKYHILRIYQHTLVFMKAIFCFH